MQWTALLHTAQAYKNSKYTLWIIWVILGQAIFNVFFNKNFQKNIEKRLKI